MMEPRAERGGGGSHLRAGAAQLALPNGPTRASRPAVLRDDCPRPTNRALPEAGRCRCSRRKKKPPGPVGDGDGSTSETARRTGRAQVRASLARLGVDQGLLADEAVTSVHDTLLQELPRLRR